MIGSLGLWSRLRSVAAVDLQAPRPAAPASRRLLRSTASLLDAASAADATDKGNIVSHTPCAVLRPGSVRDIQRMIRYCRRHDLEVAVRGQGHTMHGQSLASGLVIENGSLNRIHSLSRHGADVDAGVRWKDLVIAAAARGLTPPVLTGYTNLSIGGTLSVGSGAGLWGARSIMCRSRGRDGGAS